MRYHFDHGESFTCLVCFLEQTNEDDIKGAQQEILNEYASSQQQGGLELKLLMDKRELEEAEVLLLLCASSFGSSHNSDLVHAYYFLLCALVLDKSKFKRFRVNNTNRSLRRRIQHLKKAYGIDPKDIQSSKRVLQSVSKHPINKVAERAAVILKTLKLIYEEDSLHCAELAERADPKANKRTRHVSPKIASTTAKHANKTRRAQRGSVSEPPARGGANTEVTTVASRDGCRNLEKEITHVSKYKTTCAPMDKDKCVTFVMQLKDVSDFDVHFLQQFDQFNVDVDRASEIALLDWIPKIGTLEGEQRESRLNILKSLFFILFRQKRYFEAARIVNCIMKWTVQETEDYWRFLMYKLYLDQELHKVSQSSDLYHRFMTHLHVVDRQIFLSLKFDALVKFGRWYKAEKVAMALTVPKVESSFGAWMKVLTSKMVLPLAYGQRDVLLRILLKEIHSLNIRHNLRDSVEAVGTKKADLLLVACELLTAIAKAYPIHRFLLADICGVLWTAVFAFEGKEAATAFSQKAQINGLPLDKRSCMDTMHSFAQTCLAVGNGRDSSILYTELHFAFQVAEWEVLLYMGKIKTMQNTLVDALYLLSSAVKAAEMRFGRANSYALALTFFSVAAELNGSRGLAENSCGEAIEINKTHRNYAGLALSRYVYACLLMQSGAIEAAIHVLSQNLADITRIRGKEKHYQVSATLTALSASYFLLGDNDQADSYHRRCCIYIVDEKFCIDLPDLRSFLCCETYTEWVKHLESKGIMAWQNLLIYHVFPKSLAAEFTFGDRLYFKLRSGS